MAKPGVQTHFNIFNICFVMILLINKVYGIRNGALADINNFKYMVVVHSKDGPRCSGSIIGDTFVLTAAHCICRTTEAGNEIDSTENEPTFFKEPKIVAGVSSYFDNSAKRIARDVEAVYVPKDHKNILILDIAVLKLKGSLNINGIHKNQLQALTLPTGNVSYENKLIMFAGFGRYEPDNASSGGVLRYAPAKIITNPQCQEKYFVDITDKHICLKILPFPSYSQNIMATCTGDSGSPMVVNNVVVGVDSVGDAVCNSEIKPTIFTRVKAFVPIIDSIMKGKPTDEVWIYTLVISNPLPTLYTGLRALLGS